MVPNPKQFACLESNTLDPFGSSLYSAHLDPKPMPIQRSSLAYNDRDGGKKLPWDLILPSLRRIWCGVDETTSAPSRVSQAVRWPCATSWRCFNGYIQGWCVSKMVQVMFKWHGVGDVLFFLWVAQTCYLRVVGCCIDFFVTGAFPSLRFRVSALKCVEMSMWFCIFRTGLPPFLIVDPIWSKNQA